MKTALTLALATLASASISASASAAENELRVTATQLRNTQGTVRCLVFAKKDGFPKEPKKATMLTDAKISGKTATCVFAGLTPGRYGVSFIHDENDNRELDTNFFGVPEEGYGFANDARGSMGPPDFKEATITFDGGKKEIRLKTEY